MMRWARLVALTLLAAPGVAHAQTPDPRSAIIARAQAAVVEIRIAPAPRPAPPKRILRLSEGDCAENGGTWLGDRRCEVVDAPFPHPPAPRADAGQMGSGFVVDTARGLILTADHIIGAGREPKVKLADGRLLPATLVGRDQATGLALLRVEAQGLAALPLAARAPMAGEPSLLIGRLLPLDTTIATSGMVGGRIPAEGEAGNLAWLSDNWMIDNLLPGGGVGGGPVLNAQGEVMGVATAIWGRDGYGQSAATIMIALNTARPVIEALASNGAVERSQVGVSLDCVNDDCRIGVIFPDSPAAAAGLQVGDAVKAIDGLSLTTVNAITRHIAARPVGATVVLDIERGGVAQRVNIVTASTRDLTAPAQE